jgi:hypothetical protein
MSNGAYGILGSAAVLSVFALAQPASALTMKECSAKYKAAHDAGVVGAMNWNDFRSAECGADATMALKKAKAAPSTATAGPSMQECSAKYQAAKDAGTLGGMTWNDFRKAGCVAKTAAAPKPAIKKEAARGAPAETTTVTQKECSVRYQAAKEAGTLGSMTWNEFRSAGCPTTIAKRSGTMTPTIGSIFPTGIATKYARERAGKARMLTCRDQYRANKAAGITEPRWTEEGGGYYSECNKRLSQQ